jgi:multidrug efflux pump subunit AcrB
MRATDRVKELLAESPVDERVSVEYGGELAENDEQMPHIAAALGIAVVIIFFILVWHFKRIATAVMMLCSLTLCFLGTALGVLIQGVDFSMTATLGIVSLMGILVRNGIIMIDYAEELRTEEHLLTREAIYHSAKRRMRPIFLTSAAASMGVLPMVLGGSGLWMPMGTVIFWGTLITMFFILTVIPIAYMMTLRGSTKRRAAREELEKQ